MTRRTLIFAGPSLSLEDVSRYPEFEFSGPAARGDILRALPAKPETIGLIDGYFGDRPSVQHKEILEALSQGIRVFGAASMGALRACELSTFGMTGVGRIYHAYANGELTRDDSVAVAHGPAELGHPALSVAEVDVLATVRALVARYHLTVLWADDIVFATRSIHYAERTWQSIASAAESRADAAQRLFALLQEGHIQAKRLDALELLGQIRRENNTRRHPNETKLQVPLTPSYRRLRRSAGLA